MDSFSLTATFHLNAIELYDAWLDSSSHAEMTGSPAFIFPKTGSNYFAWDKYITGKILELTPGERIYMTFRTTEFAATDEDSFVEIVLKTVRQGTSLTLNHSHIPPGQGESYRKGWLEYYFEPMAEYFEIG